MFSFFWLFGGFVLIWKIVAPICWSLCTYCIGVPLFSKRKYLAANGGWAIVTGATDGIGKAFAEELAKDGLNIYLISRTQSKLEKVALELRTNFRIQTKIFVADFATTDFYSDLESGISELPLIACLVNNVGMSLSIPDFYATENELGFEWVQKMLNCNIMSLSCVTRIALAKMEKQHTYSVIFNISSFSAHLPTPLLTLYAASKSFVLHFSKSLALETKHVHVKTLIPYFVSTSMTMNRRPSMFVPTAEQYAKSAITTVGVEQHGAGYLPHAILGVFTLALPSFVYNKIILSKMLILRERSLAKIERMKMKTG